MGADVSSIDLTGSPPLHYALHYHGNEASVHHILHLGASMVDQFRGMYADCVPSGQLQEPNHTIIEMLLAAGADIAKLNYYGASPLKWAVARMASEYFRKGDCCKALEWLNRARLLGGGDPIA